MAAEVILIPRIPGQVFPLWHTILGVVAIDVPFLGIHPGVVGTGIASLFRSPPEESPAASPMISDPSSPQSAFSATSPSDPHFNPSYTNDVRLTSRTGKINKAFYFFNKHWGEVTKATSDYVTSHLEHGGVLADYPGMKRRYEALRGFEEIDPYANPDKQRVRFVNYYSASTGRVKERKKSPSPSREASGPEMPVSEGMQNLSLTSSAATAPTTASSKSSPRLSLEEHRPSGEIIRKSLDELPAEAMPDDSADEADTINLTPETSSTAPGTSTTSHLDFPSLAPLPDPPPPFDESKQYLTPDCQKIARKEHERLVKAHNQLVKDRQSNLRDREKLIQKQERVAQREADKRHKEQLKRSATLNPEEYDKQLSNAAKSAQSRSAPNKQKDRKFCTLPKKDSKGRRDPTWVRVYMEGIDEVVAHTSMFKMNETYAKLVGDTATRIEDWVKEDATRRAVMEDAGE